MLKRRKTTYLTVLKFIKFMSINIIWDRNFSPRLDILKETKVRGLSKAINYVPNFKTYTPIEIPDIA